MGEVWKARDTRLDRTVAIKVLKDKFGERFEREAHAVAALNHPHICQLYDVGSDYLVMELIEGIPLKGPLPVEKAVEYSGQILDALDAAHRKGITHRDLKPANILVTKQGIKLLDFGLAKQAAHLKETDVTNALTEHGQIVGTLQYMSPEQLQGKEADARSDLFAFGCVLYEMLTGKRAFDAENTASVIAAILERDPAPRDIAPPLQRVIETCLAKDPDLRFQNALDLKRDLAWVLESTAAAGPSRRGWIAAAATLVVGAAGGWSVSHFLQAPAEERVLRLEMNPPEGMHFGWGTNATGISLSPDGKAAAYVATGSGKSAIWVQALDGTTPRLLAGTEDAGLPFWSPDNKTIAFFARGKLQRMDLVGGESQTICDVGSARGGAWGNNGVILYGGWNSGIFQVAASGGTSSPLTHLDASRGELFHYWPQILPGGRFLYLVRSNKPENSGVFAASLARPTERVQLLATNTNALYAPGIGASRNKGYLLWLRDGTLVAQDFDSATLKLAGEPHTIASPAARMNVSGQMQAAVSAAGILLYSASNPLRELTWIDRAGKPMGTVGELLEMGFLRLAPDGRRLAVSRPSPGGADLWILDVGRGVDSRFTSRSVVSIEPVWSPDGRTIAFASGPPFNIFSKDSSGASAEQRLTSSPNPQFPMDWSSDGRFILFAEAALGTQTDLWMLPTAPSDSKPRPYLQTPFNEDMGRFSPDTRWVAYQSDESGRYEIYIDAFPEPRGKVRISTGGGAFPQWGAGGRELYYVSPDSKLMFVSLKLDPGAVKPSAPHVLFPVPVMDTGLSPYNSASDGHRFLVLETPEKAAQPLRVIANWPALVRKGSTAP
jgi:Tol biopolymer transport system component/predicted Ser/Thr protein kinase